MTALFKADLEPSQNTRDQFSINSNKFARLVYLSCPYQLLSTLPSTGTHAILDWTTTRLAIQVTYDLLDILILILISAGLCVVQVLASTAGRS